MSSDKTEATDARPKKGKGMVMKLVGALVLIGAGGGGAFGLVQAGVLGGGAKHEKEDNNPKLIRKGEEDPYAPKTEDKEGEGGSVEVEGEGGNKYRTVYYSFTDDFTSNLKNSDSLVQFSAAASTRRDGRVLMWMKKHELAIRSDMLAVIADTPEEDVYTPEGKQRLQKRLTATINHVLERTEGFGGVDDVYFKNFLVQ